VTILRWLFPIAWFLAKTFAFLFIYVWLRAALPRLRYDQLMDLGWKFLIPVSLAWLLFVAVAEIFGSGWPFWATVAVVIASGVLLFRAVRVGHARGDAIVDPDGGDLEPAAGTRGPAGEESR
jgi:NADH-quinone oxidoreductase subunit H